MVFTTDGIDADLGARSPSMITAAAAVSLSPTRQRLVALAAAALSGAMLLVVLGLHPRSTIAWFAMIPLYLLAARVRGRLVFGAGFVAGMVGASTYWSYATSTLELPIGMVAAYLIAIGALLGCTALAFDRLTVAGRPIAAAFVAPAVWAIGEWAAAMFSPNGAWLSLGYTQVDHHRLLAFVSITGVYGLSYVLLAVPALCVVLINNFRHRLLMIIAAAALLAVCTTVLVYGAAYQAPEGSEASVQVVMIALPQPYDPVDVDTPAGREVLNAYVSEVRREAISADLIVLPEKIFAVTPSTRTQLINSFANAIDGTSSRLVVGAVDDDTTRGGSLRNIALALDPGAGAPATYAKHFLIPSYESLFTLGSDLAWIGPSTDGWAIEICKDMDFPTLSRQYASAGAQLIAVPAWDFDDDGWLHSRIAFTRGVETGTSIVRTARNGVLLASDASGQVVAERVADADRPAVARATIPLGSGDTPYDRVGDAFAWVCVVLVLVGAVVMLRGRAGAVDEP